jgi:hypothetical protein
VIASIESQLGGKAEFDWRPEGLVCGLSVPLSSHGVAADPVASHQDAATLRRAER